MILSGNKDLIPREKYGSRYAKSVFTLVSCDLPVHRHRRDREPSRMTEKKLSRLFYKKAENGGNLLEHIWLTVYRGHPHFIVLLGDHLLVNTSIGASSGCAFKSKQVVCNTFPKAWMNRRV